MKSPKRVGLAEWILGFFLVLIVAAVFFPLYGGSYNRSYTVMGISNAKQCGLGVLIYAADYDDLFPYVRSSSAVIPLILPYTKNNDVWQTRNEGRPGVFQFNLNLGGAKSLDVPDLQNIPMIYDPFGRRAIQRDNSTWKFISAFTKPAAENSPWKFVVAFGDGHAKSMTEDTWKETAKRLALSFKRHGNPID